MDRAAFDRQLEKGFDAQEVSTELSPGATPVHVLTEESEHPEYRYLRLERLAGGPIIAVAGGAGTFSQGAVINPAASNALVIVRDVTIVNPTAAVDSFSVRLGLLPAAAAFTTVPGFLLDTRYGPLATVRATGLLGGLSSATINGNTLVARAIIPANSMAVIEGPWVLGPGSFINCNTTAANTESRYSYRWIERRAEPGELQGAGV